jgi:uncharacterized protein with HEPN domain
MQPETRKHLVDILDAAADIRDFTDGYDLAAYRADAKCRAAVERKCEIIGEACSRIRDKDPGTFGELPYGHQVIGLRNRVIHGYDSVDDAIIWDVVSSKLDSLIRQVESIASP